MPNFFASVSMTDSSGTRQADAGSLRRMSGGFLLLLGHLLGHGNLVRTELADRKQLFDDDTLRDDRLELVVDDIDGVDLGTRVALDDGASPYR